MVGPLVVAPVDESASDTSMTRLGLLFNYDWDALAFARSSALYDFDEAGFDLFSFQHSKCHRTA